MPTNLKLISFNLRLEASVDGCNRFSLRKNRITEFINEANADIIGFQEVSSAMRAWLVETFVDYYMIGVGRTADYEGEAVVLAFRKDRMALMSCDTVMLSNTPSVFGSRYDGSDQSSCPRVYVKACLKHREIAEPFYVYNVHTDHVGKLSRMLASTQLLQDITSHQKKFFLLGDFNATPDSAEIQMITKCRSRQIVDATENLSGTFHGFGTLQTPIKIDYIFSDASVPILASVKVQDEPTQGLPYLSDHNPIYIVAEI